MPLLSSSQSLGSLRKQSLIDGMANNIVEAMNFDTTSGNVGRLNGVYTLLELKLGRELL